MTIAIIAVTGVFFLGMGVYALAAPAALIRPFGIELRISDIACGGSCGLRRFRSGDRGGAGVCGYCALGRSDRHSPHRRCGAGRDGSGPDRLRGIG